MKFFVSGGRVNIESEGQELSCTIEQFQALEPEFNYLSGAYEQWTPEQHYVIEEGSQKGPPPELVNRELYLSKLEEYQAALQPEPEPEPEPQPQADWQGFAAWRYQHSAYLELVDAMPGRVALFEGAIARGEYASAIAILQSVAASGAVPPELAEALATAARQFHLPEELIQALLGVLGNGE